jgi:carboxypeptidase C (cathepsin A)
MKRISFLKNGFLHQTCSLPKKRWAECRPEQQKTEGKFKRMTGCLRPIKHNLPLLRDIRLIAKVGCLFLAIVPIAPVLMAQEGFAQSVPVIYATVNAPHMSEPIVERRHEIRISKVLNYTTRAGRLPIIDNQTGQVQAWIFFTAYVMDRKPGEPVRPLTFIWNGGPGGSSTLVHLVGFGPRRIVVPDNPPLGGPGKEKIEIVDNPDTWLTHSDLVFVDPVGTGFSRAMSQEAEAKFLNTRGDGESIAEFIRVYRNRFQAWDQPVIQGGESYGVTRAAWAAEALLRRKVPLSGVLLITWDIPLGDMPEPERHALSLPTFTAAAFYHKRLATDLQADFDRTMAEVSAWSQGEYREAVARPEKLSAAQRAAIIAKLARYTGLNPRLIDSKTLSISTGFYSENLLKDQQLALGRYDSRFVTSSVPPLPPSGHRLYMDFPDYQLVERYLRDEIGVQTDLQYMGANADTYSVLPPEQRRSVGGRWEDDPGVYQEKPLESAFRINPHLKVFEICGYYDLGANCIGDQYIVNKSGPAIARNVMVRLYKGGHAPYYVAEVRSQLRRDFAEFVEGLVK